MPVAVCVFVLIALYLHVTGLSVSASVLSVSVLLSTLSASVSVNWTHVYVCYCVSAPVCFGGICIDSVTDACLCLFLSVYLSASVSVTHSDLCLHLL